MEEKNKNILHNSNIKADGNIHIGDIIYQQEQANMPKNNDIMTLVERLHDLIANGQSKDAITEFKKFTKEEGSLLYQSAIQLSNRWEAFEDGRLMGRLSRREENHERDILNADLLDLLGKLKNDGAFKSNQMQPNSSNLPTVVILTAIKEEYLAVRAHLDSIVEADRNDTSYETGIFKFEGKVIAKVFIRECGPKNTTAAQETERAIQYFKPDVMFFVGIAGSRKPNDFAIGNVIFPEKVYSYEGGKSEKDSFVARPDIAAITYTLKEIAKKERLKEDWKALIKGNWSKSYKADLGVIASGEQVVEHYNSEIGKILTANYNDTSAVEMEGFGFANAANKQGRATSNVLIGIVRGISDIIEQPAKSKKNNNEDRRPANAKQFASDTAAAFAFWLIFKLYNN